MRLRYVIIPVLALALFSPLLAYAEPQMGKLQVTVKLWGGERPGHHGMLLKVYQGNNNTANEITPTSNPFEVALPIGPKYKVELFAGGMHADFAFVDMREKNQKLELSMPSGGSLLLTAYHEDGHTPLEGAEVSLRSADGKFEYWTNSTTDKFGKTFRYWLQPTMHDGEYYIADFYLGKELKYTYSPITIQPSHPYDIKVVTPWPDVIDQLITVSVYESGTKVSGLEKKLYVELYDSKGDLLESSKINHKGDAHFYNLEVGTYTFRAVNQTDTSAKVWGTEEVTLTGRTGPISIQAKPYGQESGENKYVQIPPPEPDVGFGGTIETTPVQPTPEESAPQHPTDIPSWIRSVADWWSKGEISDQEFLRAIEYLINNRIISVQFLQSG